MKENEGYYKAKVDRQDFHLTSEHIVQLLGVSDDGGKIFFNNVQLEHILTEFVSREELDGTVVTVGTILTNPLKAWDLTKIVLVFRQMIGTNILLHIGHHSEFSSYAAYTL